MSQVWINACLDENGNVQARVHACEGYGPPALGKDATASVDINFDPSKPAPKMKHPDGATPGMIAARERANAPSQLDLPPALAAELKAVLQKIIDKAAPAVIKSAKRAAAIHHVLALGKGEYDVDG